MTRLWNFACFVTLVGCATGEGRPPGSFDAGARDARAADGGDLPSDVGVDAATDGAPGDSGSDAGESDSGTDADSAVDGGAVDAGAVDAGAVDGGADAGFGLDAGPCDDACDWGCDGDACDVPVEVSVGQHSCVRTRGGRVYCWGPNASGQVGDGTTTPRLRPTLLDGIEDATQVETGTEHTCVLHATGAVSCWGENSWLRLGLSGTTDRLVPTDIPGLGDVVEIAAGGTLTCVRVRSGQGRCFGQGIFGQLGDGSSPSSSATPRDVLGLTNAIDITAGHAHACAIRETGQAVCWGRGDDGALGDGTERRLNTPTDVTGLSDGIALGSSNNHTC
ncbi:MAG: hypothetical protein AAGE52_35760, partial [Myxococcota bacterium]